MNEKYKYPGYLKLLMKEWDAQYEWEMKVLSKKIAKIKARRLSNTHLHSR